MVVAVEKYRIGYVAVPKAACSSVKTTLFHLRDDLGRRKRRVVAENPDKVHRQMPTRRFRDYRFAEYEGWHRFTVVRDPIQRLLATYTDRVVKRNEIATSKNVLRGEVDLVTEPDPDYFFQNLETYVEWVSVIRHHVMNQRAFTGADLGVYDRIYTTRDLGTLAQDLSGLTGRHVDIPHLNPSKARLSFDDLQPETRDLLIKRTKIDYKLLRAYFTPPAG